MLIQFPRWRPDQYDVDAVSSLAGEAKNVLLTPNGYGPWPSAVNYGQALGAGTACRGGYLARNNSGTLKVFAGTATTLERFVDSSTAWDDVTRLSGGAYGVPSDERWGFAQFRDNLIAANRVDALQYIDISSGSNFAAVSGSPPTAGGVKAVGSFVFLFNLVDNPERIQWCSRGNMQEWTPGLNDGDYEDFPDGGTVYAMSALETGLIFQEGAVRRYRPTNDRKVFEFGLVEGARGVKGPDAISIVGRTAYYLSEDGFYATSGDGQSVPIGAEKVDEWFQSMVNYDRLYYTTACTDPTGRRIYFLFASEGVTGEGLDTCLCYDRFLEDWTYADSFATSFMMPAATPGATVEGMNTIIVDQGYNNIEDYPVSFDSKALSGGAPWLAGFHGTTFKMQQHDGSARAATLETADWRPIPNKRSMVRGARFVGDATAATIAFGAKERPQGSVSFGSAVSQDARGFCYSPRTNGYYHRQRVSIAAGETWTEAKGIDIEKEDVVEWGER